MDLNTRLFKLKSFLRHTIDIDSWNKRLVYHTECGVVMLNKWNRVDRRLFYSVLTFGDRKEESSVDFTRNVTNGTILMDSHL